MIRLADELSSRHEVAIICGGSTRDESLVPDSLQTVVVPFFSRKRTPTGLPGMSPYLVESASFFTAGALSRSVVRCISESDVISTHAKYDSLFFSRLAHTCHTASLFHVQGSKFGPWFRRIDCSDRYVAVSETIREDLVRRAGLSVPATVTPGVPDKLLTLPRAEEEIVLFVARLQPSKGTLEAIRIFHRILESFPDLCLIVLGDGPDRLRMETEARRLSVADRVRFMGAMPQDQVLPFYSKAKLLLFPSSWEVYPLVPLEAMAGGCPVVAGDIPATREGTGGRALLLPVDDTELWADQAKRILADASTRQRMSALGRDWARERTWKKAASRYEEQLRLASEALD